MAEQVYIKEIDSKEKIVHLTIVRQIGGVSTTQKAKAFKNAEPHLKVGEKVEAVVEVQPAQGNFPESLLVKPVAADKRGGGGAGIQQASKEKNAVIEKTSASKNASIEHSSRLKCATSCMEMAVATLGPDLDINQYRERTFDLYQIVQEVAAIGSKEAK